MKKIGQFLLKFVQTLPKRVAFNAIIATSCWWMMVSAWAGDVFDMLHGGAINWGNLFVLFFVSTVLTKIFWDLIAEENRLLGVVEILKELTTSAEKLEANRQLDVTFVAKNGSRYKAVIQRATRTEHGEIA